MFFIKSNFPAVKKELNLINLIPNLISAEDNSVLNELTPDGEVKKAIF